MNDDESEPQAEYDKALRIIDSQNEELHQWRHELKQTRTMLSLALTGFLTITCAIVFKELLLLDGATGGGLGLVAGLLISMKMHDREDLRGY